MSVPCGIIVPIITPLVNDESIDKPALRKLTRHCLNGGVHGIFACGSSGFGFALSEEMWREAVETVLEEAGNPAVVQVGILEPSTIRAKARARVLSSMGVRTMVATAPYYMIPRSDDEYFAHFAAVAAAGGLPLVTYDIPAFTGSRIPDTVLYRLAEEGISKDCKDSSGDTQGFARRSEGGAQFGLRMYMGLYPDFAWLKDVGAFGCVPVPANLFPAPFVAAYTAAEKADVSTDTIQESQARVKSLWDGFVKGFDFMSAAVYGLSVLGIGSGYMPAPFKQCSPARRKEVEILVDRFGG